MNKSEMIRLSEQIDEAQILQKDMERSNEMLEKVRESILKKLKRVYGGTCFTSSNGIVAKLIKRDCWSFNDEKLADKLTQSEKANLMKLKACAADVRRRCEVDKVFFRRVKGCVSINAHETVQISQGNIEGRTNIKLQATRRK